MCCFALIQDVCVLSAVLRRCGGADRQVGTAVGNWLSGSRDRDGKRLARHKGGVPSVVAPGAAHEPAQDAAVTQLSNQEQPQQQQEQPQLLQEQPQQQQEQPQQQQEQPQLHEVHEEAVVLGFTPEYEEELPINMY